MAKKAKEGKGQKKRGWRPYRRNERQGPLPAGDWRKRVLKISTHHAEIWNGRERCGATKIGFVEASASDERAGFNQVPGRL